MVLARKAVVLLAVCMTLASAGAGGQTVVRGPYLQRATPSSIVVRWRTDAPTDSLVEYGLQAGAPSMSAGVPGARTEHEVELSGLDADTRYFYSVGSSSALLAGGDRSHHFVTPPAVGTATPTRIWVIGDSGTANANALAVRDAYRRFAPERDTDLWLMLGDNASVDGTDAEYQRAVFDLYPELLRQAVLWPTLGNHDGRTADSIHQTGPYYDMFTLPSAAEAGGLPSGTEAGNPITPGSRTSFQHLPRDVVRFQDGVSPTAAYTGTRDTYIEEAQPTRHFGSDLELVVDGDDPPFFGLDVATLLAWDVSQIPAHARVESASIAIDVSNTSFGIFRAHELLGPWTELQATWNESAAASPWQSPGAEGPGDRGALTVGDIGGRFFGSYTIDLNAHGVAMVQGWVDGSAGNHGVILAGTDTPNGLDFRSRDTPTAGLRPALTVTYTLPPDPDGDGIASDSDNRTLIRNPPRRDTEG